MTTQEKIDFIRRAMNQIRTDDLWKISHAEDGHADWSAAHERYEKKWQEAMDWLEGKFPPF